MNPFKWVVSKLDKKERLKKFGENVKSFIHKRPLLKTLATLALVCYTAFNVVMTVVSFPVFGAAVTRKNTDLKNDYAAAAVCMEKARNGQDCTPQEVLSLKKAWDNDIMMCVGHGPGCLAERAANPLVPPKHDATASFKAQPFTPKS